MKTRLSMVVLFLGALMAIQLCEAAEESKQVNKGVNHVNPKEAQKLVEDKKVVVLDVRTPDEFKKGHIPGATNIDFTAPDFEKRIGELDKSKTYLVHCASGGRSKKSLPILKKEDLRSVYHLDGGFNSWEKQGLPVEK